MNPGEQNGEQDILNFLHSEHDTFFEYNQEKLGSDIHASDVQHRDNLTMQSTMENIDHGSTGSSATKMADHFEMENPHETDSSQYVDEPGCVPIENEPVQTAPPLQTMTSHPVAAPVMTQSTNIVQVGPGPSNAPVVPSASAVQVPATLQVPLVYTKPIMGPITGQFLVQRLNNHTNNLVIIPPAGFMLKTLGTPVMTDNHVTNSPSTLNRKQGQRRTLSPVVMKGPVQKKARIIQSVLSGPIGPMNSRGQKNNPTMPPAHVPPPVEISNRFDISRYQAPRVQENNFQEDDDVNEGMPQIQGQNVSEQFGDDEQIFDLVPVP
jgi:hypothetical protein